jgi:hypothetical protein
MKDEEKQVPPPGGPLDDEAFQLLDSVIREMVFVRDTLRRMCGFLTMVRVEGESARDALRKMRIALEIVEAERMPYIWIKLLAYLDSRDPVSRQAVNYWVDNHDPKPWISERRFLKGEPFERRVWARWPYRHLWTGRPSVVRAGIRRAPRPRRRPGHPVCRLYTIPLQETNRPGGCSFIQQLTSSVYGS